MFWLDCILKSTQFLSNSISNPTCVDIRSVNVCVYVCMSVIEANPWKSEQLVRHLLMWRSTNWSVVRTLSNRAPAGTTENYASTSVPVILQNKNFSQSVTWLQYCLHYTFYNKQGNLYYINKYKFAFHFTSGIEISFPLHCNMLYRQLFPPGVYIHHLLV